jgi:hypothetical protein
MAIEGIDISTNEIGPIDHRQASRDRASIADPSMAILDGSMIFDSRSPICDLRCPTRP